MNKYELVAITVAVPLVSYLKKSFEIEGPLAFWLSVIVSLVLAAVVHWIEVGQESFFADFGKVFMGAQAAYNILKQTPLEEKLK